MQSAPWRCTRLLEYPSVTTACGALVAATWLITALPRWRWGWSACRPGGGAAGAPVAVSRPIGIVTRIGRTLPPGGPRLRGDAAGAARAGAALIYAAGGSWRGAPGQVEPGTAGTDRPVPLSGTRRDSFGRRRPGSLRSGASSQALQPCAALQCAAGRAKNSSPALTSPGRLLRRAAAASVARFERRWRPGPGGWPTPAAAMRPL